MPNDPQSLLTSGNCLLCYNLTLAQAMEIQLLINKLQGGGGTTPCVPPLVPAALSVNSTTDTIIDFALGIPIPPPTVGFVIKWGVASGGPYTTGSKSFGLAGAIQIGSADGLIAGTQYFFVAYSDNGSGCLSATATAEVASRLNIPVTSGLILQNESMDFVASVAGSNILQWRDTSGNAHHWINGQNPLLTKANSGGALYPATVPPTVDKTITANGKPTVRFPGAASPAYMQQADFFGAVLLAGLEMMVVVRMDADPPISDNAGNCAQFNHPLAQFPNHTVFSDGHNYEGFGRTTRPDDGDPATSFTSFRLYNVASKRDGTAYDIWIDAENLVSLVAGYTYQQQGAETANDHLYFLALSEWYTSGVYCMKGNIAAVYVWNRRLSAGERASMRTYINSTFGTAA